MAGKYEKRKRWNCKAEKMELQSGKDGIAKQKRWNRKAEKMKEKSEKGESAKQKR